MTSLDRSSDVSDVSDQELMEHSSSSSALSADELWQVSFFFNILQYGMLEVLFFTVMPRHANFNGGKQRFSTVFGNQPMHGAYLTMHLG